MDEILLQARRFRSDTPITAVEGPFLGGSHQVFKITFQVGMRWAARTCTNDDLWSTELQAAEQLQYLKSQQPGMKAPSTFIDEEHHVVFAEWVEGGPLAVWNIRIPLDTRHRMLDDLAEFLLQLWSIPVPGSLSCSTTQPYPVWLTESLDRGLRRTLNGTAR